ncbi:hypothetical protein B0I18_11190 [Taibaiella chishuiensis]|uniref:Uncharacterized protein n=1 Tax=Taibaiella chishuiensis TaxID=1434707 RepID=A0A2P8CX35_9BACT|nr:hypothetical protein B0I18_11190 [Taibaiella chishuiensis]
MCILYANLLIFFILFLIAGPYKKDGFAYTKQI